MANEKIEVIDVKYSTAPLNDEDYPIEYSALVLYEDKSENERTVEIGQVYRVMDGNPPVFGKVIKMTANKYWNDYWEEEEIIKIAWGDWYQWNDKRIRKHFNAGFETRRLVPATQEEIEVYEKKVMEYQLEVPNERD